MLNYSLTKSRNTGLKSIHEDDKWMRKYIALEPIHQDDKPIGVAVDCTDLDNFSLSEIIASPDDKKSLRSIATQTAELQ